MGKYDSLLQKKTSNEQTDFSKNKYVSLLGNKKTSFKERLTGTPTKNYDNTYKANTGILPFLAEIPKTLVSGTVGTGKILGESMAVNRGDFDALNKANQNTEDIKLALVKKIIENKKSGKDNTKLINEYNRLNPSDTIKSLAPNSQVSNLEALGNVGMMGIEATGLSSLARSAKAFGYIGKEAEKQFVKNLTAKELKKRLAAEVAFNTAQGYGTDVAMKAQQDKKDFSPGIGTALGFGATLLVGNQQLNKTLNEQSAARIAAKKAQTFNIPEAGTPPLPKQLEAPSIKLPAKGILEGQQKLREGFPKQVVNQTTTQFPKIETPSVESKPQFDSQGFRKVETGEVLPNGYTTKMNQTTGETMTNAPIKETQTQPVKNLNEEFDNIEKQAQQEINNKPLEVDSINLKAEGEKAKVAINTLGKEKARRIALGIDEAPNGVRAGAIHSELTNIAKKEGDYELGAELANSDIFKPSSQEINLAKNREPNSFYWNVKDIIESRRKNRNIVIKLNEKSEINNISKRLRETIDSISLDNLSIKKLAAKLICK